MQTKNLVSRAFGSMVMLAMVAAGCQKMDKPELGDYPRDTNPPGGPLSFYTAFDGTTTDPLMNAVDSIRANFPADNPFTSDEGISGKGLKGVNQKYVKYTKPNDWATKAKSFSISVWYKKDGQTKNNKGGNGPEYLVSFKSNNGHWSGANFFLFLEGNNAACAVKMMACDKAMRDNWFTWEGGNTIAGLLDNKWHHLVVVYDAATSKTTLYIDGRANNIQPSWNGHGDIGFDNNAISEFRVGAGPSNNFDSDDWLACSFKGNLDQVRMYASALNATEVQGLFTNKK